MGSSEPPKCRLFEIEQFICELLHDSTYDVKCYPFPRIFRICPGRPAVEITALVNINVDTGEVDVPPRTSETLPKGRPWRDIVPASSPSK